jgi:8-oxo-dGTP pyrophosphatase MutT (NUDIX family)
VAPQGQSALPSPRLVNAGIACHLHCTAILYSWRQLSMNGKTKGLFLLNPGTTRTQYGALCWRRVNGAVEVLLITSRETGRWVIPKGWPMDGHTPEAAAAREAWQEAGAKGEVSAGCIGLFAYDKVIGPGQTVPCVVAVYPLRVITLDSRFPERKERRRKWFPLAKAAGKVSEPELRAILATFGASVPGG